jgi:hypothetical protein
MYYNNEEAVTALMNDIPPETKQKLDQWEQEIDNRSPDFSCDYIDRGDRVEP